MLWRLGVLWLAGLAIGIGVAWLAVYELRPGPALQSVATGGHR